MIIRPTEKDILRSKLVSPGWYRVRIDEVNEALSAKGDSTNIRLEGTVLYNADDLSKDFAGCPTPYWNFNTKAISFMFPFIESLGATVAVGEGYETKQFVGKETEIFIDNELFEGRMIARFNHKYRKPAA